LNISNDVIAGGVKDTRGQGSSMACGGKDRPKMGPRWLERGSKEPQLVLFSPAGLAAPPFIRFDIRHDISLNRSDRFGGGIGIVLYGT
jgi:hypothetical protein